MPFDTTMILADLGWLAVFAAPSFIATVLSSVILITVWLTGGLRS